MSHFTQKLISLETFFPVNYLSWYRRRNNLTQQKQMSINKKDTKTQRKQTV